MEWLPGWPRRPCSGLLQPCSPGEPADLSRVPERPDNSVPGLKGTETKFPGAAFSRTPTGSVRVVPEEGEFLEKLVPREAGPAKMIQAILVFNNHGKPRLVRFYQRFVSAARPATPLRNTRTIPFPRPAGALSSTSGSGTVHDPPTLLLLHPSWILAFLCFVTLPLGLRARRSTQCSSLSSWMTEASVFFCLFVFN